MPRGNWETFNKIIPGIYIRYSGIPTDPINSGVRGTVAIARELNWGDPTELISITDTSGIINTLGYDINSDELRFVRQIFAGTRENSNAQVTVDGALRSDGANQILLKRLSGTGGVAATGTADELTATAKYPGTRGNDITYTITADPDTEFGEDGGEYAVMIVRTIVDGLIRNTQRVGTYINNTTYTQATIADLQDNAWINWSGTPTAVLVPTAGVTLDGGVNPTVTATSHAEFLDLLAPSQYNVLIYDGTDTAIKNAYLEYINNTASDTGYIIRLVTSNFLVDNESVLSVKNGYYIGEDHYPLNEATWWVGGLDAGCPLNSSLTNVAHPTATRPDVTYNTEQLEEAILEGSFAFYADFNEVRVLIDKNTFTSVNDDITQIYQYGHTGRVVADMVRTMKDSFSRGIIGKMKNTEEARVLFKGQLIEILNNYLSIGAIEAYDPDQIRVEPVEEQPESVYVLVIVYIGNFILKIYTDIKVY